jgi:pimeloyl-ACP methyl ester carboxylesterase
MPTIVLCHGLESGPFGPKYHSLCAEFGSDNVISPDCEGVYDIDERLRIVAEAVIGRDELIFVGSSFGGAVSAAFATAHPDRIRGVVLCNPALGMARGKTLKLPKKTVILHAIDDRVIPISGSERFSETHNVRLLAVPNDDHKFDRSHGIIVAEVRAMLA